jgi:isopenicillin N synthase-like dioxygenase
MYTYYSDILAFSYNLLRIFALALDMLEDSFDSVCKFAMTAIRALNYPAQETASGQDIGIGAHTDVLLVYARMPRFCPGAADVE